MTQQTQTQQTAFKRALTRAHRAGLRVVGRGKVRRTGEKFYAVNSATEPGRWHIVVLRGGQLVCDCIGAQQWGRPYCQHRAVVREQIIHEQWERERDAQIAATLAQAAAMNRTTDATLARVSAALDAADARRAEAKRETAPMAQRPAFSIWASEPAQPRVREAW